MHPIKPALALRLALSFVACAAPSLAAAQADLQRVEISGRRPAEVIRFDVKQACQGIETQLDAELSPAIQMIGETGSLRVQFRVDGQKISEVRSFGGPRKYSGEIRRAVRRLQCSDGGGAQQFAFTLKIVEPSDDAAGPQRLALLIGP